VDHHLHAVEEYVATLGAEMTPEAMATFRQRLWKIGNQLIPIRGRQRGTRYWRLGLECGHEVDTRARSRLVDGASVHDPHPVRTRCPTCSATQPVLTADLRRTG
jgi:hypothetical protein